MANLIKRGKNSYRITVFNGYDSTGNQIRETTTFKFDGNKTEKQNMKALEQFVIDFERKVQNGELYKGEKMTMQEFSEIWLEQYAKKQMEETSYDRTCAAFRNAILPSMANMKMAKIKPLHIEKLYNDMLERGFTTSTGKHKEYSHNTIKRIHQILNSAFNWAVKKEIVESNPVLKADAPKVEKSIDVKHFELDQAQRFLNYLDSPYEVIYRARPKKDGSPSVEHREVRSVPTQIKVLFYMAMIGGFRRGEIMALTWDDIDFNNRQVEINKASAYTKANGVITKKPKTASSVRYVTLDQVCIALLKTWKAEQSEYRLSIGSEWQGKNYIFIQEGGRQMNLDTPNRIMLKTIKRYNAEHPNEPLPEITLHGLRHTSATLMIANGDNIKTVQARLGHADASTTMDIYAHSLKKREQEAADSLSEMLFSKRA